MWNIAVTSIDILPFGFAILRLYWSILKVRVWRIVVPLRVTVKSKFSPTAHTEYGPAAEDEKFRPMADGEFRPTTDVEFSPMASATLRWMRTLAGGGRGVQPHSGNEPLIQVIDSVFKMRKKSGPFLIKIVVLELK